MKSFLKRFAVFLLIFAFIPCSAYAAETESSEDTDTSLADTIEENAEEIIDSDAEEEEDTSSSLSSSDLSSIFSSLSSSLLDGSDFSLSSSISDATGTSVSSTSLYDVSNMTIISDTILDMGMTNLQYESLASSLTSSYESTDLSGSALTAEDLFGSTYSDVSVSLEEYSLDISTSDILSSASDTISSLYSSTTESDYFSGIKNSISTSDIFAIASAGATEYSLSDASTLLDTVSDATSDVATSAYSTYSSGASSLLDEAANADVASSANSVMLSLNSYLSSDEYSSANGVNPNGTIDTETTTSIFESAGLDTEYAANSEWDSFGSRITDNIGTITEDASDLIDSFSSWYDTFSTEFNESLTNALNSIGG